MPHGSHPNLFYQFKNGPFRASLFFFSAVIMVIIKFCWCLDTNGRPLESEATTLPTEPQPLPNLLIFVQVKNFGVFWPTFELLSTVSRRSTSGFDHFRRPRSVWDEPLPEVGSQFRWRIVIFISTILFRSIFVRSKIKSRPLLQQMKTLVSIITKKLKWRIPRCQINKIESLTIKITPRF